MKTVARLGAVAVAALAAMAFVGAVSASAFTGIGVDDPVFAEGENVQLGSFIECDNSYSGVITVDDGPGNGGEGEILSGTIDNCNVGDATPDFTTPWTVSVDGAGDASITDINVEIDLGGLGTCTYEGDLTGDYNEVSGEAVLDGNLDRTSGFCFGGGSSEEVEGTFMITDDNGQPVQL